jgi:hypothetical protein
MAKFGSSGGGLLSGFPPRGAPRPKAVSPVMRPPMSVKAPKGMAPPFPKKKKKLPSGFGPGGGGGGFGQGF